MTEPATKDPTRALAQRYRRFGEVGAGTSPLHQRTAVALSRSEPALRAIATAPYRYRNPATILAALHDLALDGRAPELAAAHQAADLDATAVAALAVVLTRTEEVVAVAVRRPARPDETGRSAVLHPAVTAAARRVGASSVGLVEVGCSAGLSLQVDRVGLRYSNGQRLGDPSSPVQQTAVLVGPGRLPEEPLPPVVARVGVDLDPLDVTDAADVRWLRACVPPDQPQRRAELDLELALAAGAPPVLLRGDGVALLPDALARVPAGALPVVLTTWTLAQLPAVARLRFLDRLAAAAADRPVAWVSAEGVGVAPAVPTLGDRPASGHSILGLVVLDRAARHPEVLGRCWSRGRLLSWLSGP